MTKEEEIKIHLDAIESLINEARIETSKISFHVGEVRARIIEDKEKKKIKMHLNSIENLLHELGIEPTEVRSYINEIRKLL